MRQVLLKGAASRLGLGFASEFPVAGKTGASPQVSDAWFAGYSDSLVVVVWIGMPDAERPIVRDGSGASLAYPVFERIMKAAPEAFPAEARLK